MSPQTNRAGNFEDQTISSGPIAILCLG